MLDDDPGETRPAVEDLRVGTKGAAFVELDSSAVVGLALLDLARGYWQRSVHGLQVLWLVADALADAGSAAQPVELHPPYCPASIG